MTQFAGLYDQPHNLLPLEEWRAFLGYHPFHFWGMANDDMLAQSSCNPVVYEYAWQSADAVGRNEIRESIANAEEMMRKYLTYSPAPHYAIDTQSFPRYPDPRFDMLGYGGEDSRWKTIRLKEGYIQDVGVETLTAIAAPAVVFSDRDGDGIDDTFSVTFPTTVTDPDEIAVYFAAADRLDGQPAGERWRINPVQVTISGGTATVTGRAWLLVKPVRYEGVSVQSIDPDIATNFAATLEAYRRYTSAGTTFDTAQAVLVWETRPWPEWAILASASPTVETDAAGEAYALARAGIRDAVNGIVTIGESVYDAASDSWALARNYGYYCRPPDRVIVRYRAGWPTEKGRVSIRFREAISALAAAELVRPICACESANRKLYDYQFDLSRSAGVNDEQYATSQDVLTNPFGTRRGHVRAWRAVEDSMLLRPVLP